MVLRSCFARQEENDKASEISHSSRFGMINNVREGGFWGM